MTDRSLPQAEEAETALLGGIIQRYPKADDVLPTLTVADFTGWRQDLFLIVLGLRRHGENTMDTAVMLDALSGSGGTVTPAHYRECFTQASTAIERLAATVVRTSVARKVILAADELIGVALTGTATGEELVLAARDAMEGIDAPLLSGAGTNGLTTVDDFLRTADTTPAPWVVPGLLRAGWRCLVVAPEGVGKSVASRQVAIAAAQGTHPFSHRPIEPVRTLIVDLENPDDAIAETCRPITDRARTATQVYDEGRAWLWRRPDGINLRTRADRAALEKVIRETRPDLVCLGPLYKAYRATARENDELAAGEVQAVLDDLRTRYGFALLMEHHAPKANGMTGRDLVPYGSSLWLRWPELGIKLLPGDGDRSPETSLNVGRFRRDRMRNSWPDRLDRGGHGRWPWVGYWAGGMDEEQAS